MAARPSLRLVGALTACAAALGAPALASGAVAIVEGPGHTPNPGFPVYIDTTSATFAFVTDPPGGSVECSFNEGPWAACASPLTLSGLAEGEYSLGVRTAGSGAAPEDRAEWRVDLLPPAGLALIWPPDGSTIAYGELGVLWVPATDRFPDPLVRGGGLSYLVVVDGVRYAYAHSIGCGRYCMPVGVHRDGRHAVSVTAWDHSGKTSTVSGSFTVAAPPVLDPLSVWLPAGRRRSVTGRPLVLRAKAHDNDPGELRYRWDLDGDGRYEAGTAPAVSRAAALPGAFARSPGRRLAAGRHRVGVQVTGHGGLTAVRRMAVRVFPSPPPGPVGVSIDGGAAVTRDVRVTLQLVWPEGATHALLSNDGGFRGARRVPVRARVPWRLDGRAPDGVARHVYVRFQPDPRRRTVQDDIVLDRSPALDG